MAAVTTETMGHNEEDKREEQRRGRGGTGGEAGGGELRLDDYYLAQ